MINSLMSGMCPGQLMEGGGEWGWMREGYYEKWEAGRHGAETGKMTGRVHLNQVQTYEDWAVDVE